MHAALWIFVVVVCDVKSLTGPGPSNESAYAVSQCPYKRHKEPNKQWHKTNGPNDSSCCILLFIIFCLLLLLLTRKIGREREREGQRTSFVHYIGIISVERRRRAYGHIKFCNNYCVMCSKGFFIIIRIKLLLFGSAILCFVVFSPRKKKKHFIAQCRRACTLTCSMRTNTDSKCIFVRRWSINGFMG